MTAAFVLVCLIWGSTWLVIQEGLRDLPPFSSAGIRFAIAAVVMTLYAWRTYRPDHGSAPPTWLYMTMGLANFATSYGIVYLTETVLPSGLVCVLWGVYPLVMALIAPWILPSERLRPRQTLGFLLGFGGVVLLFVYDVLAFGSEGLAMAALLLASPVVTAVSTLLVKRHGGRCSSVLLNRNAMFVGAFALLGLAAAVEDPAEIHLTGSAVFSLLYLSLFGTCVTFGIYFWLMRHWPANRLSLIAYLTPVVALVLGTAVGGEAIAWHTVLGTVLILLGVGLGMRG